MLSRISQGFHKMHNLDDFQEIPGTQFREFLEDFTGHNLEDFQEIPKTQFREFLAKFILAK